MYIVPSAIISEPYLGEEGLSCLDDMIKIFTGAIWAESGPMMGEKIDRGTSMSKC